MHINNIFNSGKFIIAAEARNTRIQIAIRGVLKLRKKLFSVIIAATILTYFCPKASAAVNLDEYVCLPVLMYHSVRPWGSDKDSITPAEFENDLKFLKENGYQTITMTDLLNFVDGRGKLPEKPIMLSFDDGYYNNYKYVYPLLKQYDMRIVLSIIANATDKFTRRPSDSEGYSHITWGQLNEMIASGHAEVQNHTYDLHATNKGRIGCKQKDGEPLEEYRAVLSEDLAKSQAMIYVMTGEMPSTFAYPYCKYNDNTVTILKELGFRASFSCNFGINLICKEGEPDLFSMRRICRAHNQSAEKMIRDAMETLKFR